MTISRLQDLVAFQHLCSSFQSNAILLSATVYTSKFIFFFFLMLRHPPRSPLFPSPPLSRSFRRSRLVLRPAHAGPPHGGVTPRRPRHGRHQPLAGGRVHRDVPHADGRRRPPDRGTGARAGDRKSTRLNSSHSQISYAVFCLK